MQYRYDRYHNPISILGYGCMRFSSKGAKIDLGKTEKEILKAYEAGVNYFDTAYIYPGSEAALGEILERNQIRDKVNIATKLPHYMIRSASSMDKFFEEEKKRLRTDHVDYYLMHMLTDVKTWERLKGFGIEEWLATKKASGEIRQVGFSYHGNSDTFCQLLDVYDWDFCQIQYNYMDEHSQAGRTGLLKAASKGIPVIIMEPLRGGKLVNLPEEALRKMSSNEHRWTPAEWSFRWLWNQPEVTCVLSGMNSLAMVEENCSTAASAQANAFAKEDFAFLQEILSIINANTKVGCTGCRYCMPCPKGVDIPGTFAAWNRQASDGRIRGMLDYFMCTGIRKEYTGASNCIGCGKCEQHCPQHIAIRDELKNARKDLEGPLYKAARKVVPLVMKY